MERPLPTAHAGSTAAERHLHLGVLAHVDAGKTSLTEALLVAGGALAHPGRVDDGTTQTDTLALERRRGITIRTAVATFRAPGVVVDLVDTPGHPDFVAEVDRALAVLDGAVLVVSAVEGVQAQTVVLHRALRRLRVPTVVFLNKVDRAGADPARVVEELTERLEVDLVALGAVRGAGTRGAAVVPTAWDDPDAREALVARLADHDDALLARWVADGPPDRAALVGALGRLTRAGTVQPLVAGSARTGAGVHALVDTVAALLTPPAPPDPGAPLDAQVFTVEHDGAGRRTCTARVRSGTLAVRDRVHLGRDRSGVVSGLQVFEPGGAVPRRRAVAGQLVRVAGLSSARVGDHLGTGATVVPPPSFPPPALRSSVVARDPAQQDLLRRALTELADVDPLFRVRPDPRRAGALQIDVYGEVQREVVAETLLLEHGVVADLAPPTPACVERPAAVGTAARRLRDPDQHRPVTAGVRVEPGAPGSGLQVVVTADRLTLPLHVYGTVPALREALRTYVEEALVVGPHGWPVTDLVVTLTESGYAPGGPAPADVRHTVVAVVAEALRTGGTVVCEPVDVVRVDAPEAAVAAVTGLLLRHGGVVGATRVRGTTAVLEGTLPTAEVDAVRTALPTAAHGLAVLESAFDHHAPRRPGSPRAR